MAENNEQELLGFLGELANDNVVDSLSGNDQPVIIPKSSIEKVKAGDLRSIETIFVFDSINLKVVESKATDAAISKEKKVPNVFKGMQVMVLEVKLKQVLQGDTEKRSITKAMFLPEPYGWKNSVPTLLSISDFNLSINKADWLNNLYHELTKKAVTDEGKKLDFSVEFTKDGKPTKELLDYFAANGKPVFTPDNKDVIQWKFKWEVYMTKIKALFDALTPEEKSREIYAKVTCGTEQYPSENYMIPDENFSYNTGGKASVFERAFKVSEGIYKPCTMSFASNVNLIPKKAEKPAGNIPQPPTGFAATGSKKPEW